MQPKSSRNGPRRALKDPKNHPRRRLEKLLAIMADPEDSKKACWRPRSAQESLLEAKISQRSRFGTILDSILGACFHTFSVPKSCPTSSPFLASFFAPFWPQKVAQTDPENLQHGTLRPEKVPRCVRRRHASGDTALYRNLTKML